MSDSGSIHFGPEGRADQSDECQRPQPPRHSPSIASEAPASRPSNMVQQPSQASSANASATNASLSSQSSLPPPSLQSRAGAPTIPSSSAPQAVRGYQTITSAEPAPKRPLWSLGSTLPRVKRLPSAKQKPAQAVPPPQLGRLTHGTRSTTTDSLGGPNETVHGRDFARDTETEYDASGEAGTHPLQLTVSPTTSTNTGAGELPPIREGEPLPTTGVPDRVGQPALTQTRPLFESSYSSPTAAETSRAPIARDEDLRPRGKQPSESVTDKASESQLRLSTARQQLLHEAQHAEASSASQGSAIDDDISSHQSPTAQGGGLPTFPSPKHIKTSSMPFLPSQGFNVLVSEPSHKGASQLHTEVEERKRSKEESHKSAMDQTRHPGLSGARPTPKGRAAGGPAAGVGVRKPSTQSRKASHNEERGGAGYFDEGRELDEMRGLERKPSTTDGKDSLHGGRSSGEDRMEPRPVGGRSESEGGSSVRDTRSGWLAKSMPSQAERHAGKDGPGEAGANQTNQEPVQAGMASEAAGRSSDDTAFSSSETDTHGAASRDGQPFESEENQDALFLDDENWLGGQGTLPDGSLAFPTTWSRWRYHGREFLAELLATMLLITVGTAVDCQVTLSQSMGSSAGAYPNQNWAWGLAVASTIYLSGGRSGAHCNPAITMALAVFRGFPWIQVPIYWSAQLLGSILGAAITYGIYLPAIDHYEGGRAIRTLSGDHGTGKLFVTVPQLVFTSASGFGTEVAATSILMAMVLAVGDETNAPPSDGLSALVLGFVVVMIGMSFGWPTSYAISPSRDLGPRLFLYMVGYGKELWTHNDYWWIYGPQAGCFAGALFGALLYDLAVFTGEESPINYTRKGWMQSTPARIGARMLNSGERMHFMRNPVRRSKQGTNAGGDHALEAETGAETDRANIDGVDEGEKADLRSSDGLRRRQSQASQQLDEQEQGRSQPGSDQDM
ncbi:hypothetical protein PHSY_002840 [Pseudozyma hubeiensis SY62]|uniref:Uncharacterized protein n=1 Tax=Pseudozyma hubeiensis (strain SY62) TaxID=1305764 RepID=R9PB19_PSEHS|nr:hypothetical protein PHSY_002840 [Pseudozyma hubeiensis SY62]GAC95265.1 hypothetical protein PHSY_002840 [Pseudozyma hubeiensis SY62]